MKKPKIILDLNPVPRNLTLEQAAWRFSPQGPFSVDMMKLHDHVDLYGLRALSLMPVPVFWDPKLYDTPEAMVQRIVVMREYASFISVHASAGSEALRAAVKATEGYRAELVAILVPTSKSDQDVYEETNGGFTTALGLSLVLAKRAVEAGIRHIVCGVPEVRQLRNAIGRSDVRFITPGIRVPGVIIPNDDQKRTGTFKGAYRVGVDYVVLGRIVTMAQDPVARLQEILG